MGQKIRTLEGRVWIDTRQTIESWVKEVGGKFASLLELELMPDEGGAYLRAKVRTNLEWDGEYHRVPDDVTFRLTQLKGVTSFAPQEPIREKEALPF